MVSKRKYYVYFSLTDTCNSETLDALLILD